MHSRKKMIDHILSAGLILIAFLLVIITGVEFKESKTLGVTPFIRTTTELTQETTVRQYLQEAEERLIKAPIQINTPTFQQVYNKSNVAEIKIEFTNDPSINCGASMEEALLGGGCYYPSDKTIVLSPNLGNGEMLRSLLVHEYAHYLQYNEALIPEHTPLPEDTHSEIECLADNMAVSLGIDKSLLYYTQSGGCKSNEFLENQNPYFEIFSPSKLLKNLL